MNRQRSQGSMKTLMGTNPKEVQATRQLKNEAARRNAEQWKGVVGVVIDMTGIAK